MFQGLKSMMQEFMSSVDKRMDESATRLESLECLWGLNRGEDGRNADGEADSGDSDTDSLARVGDDDDIPAGQPAHTSRRLTLT